MIKKAILGVTMLTLFLSSPARAAFPLSSDARLRTETAASRVPSLSLMTPGIVYGETGFKVQVQLVFPQTAPVTEFTAYCQSGGELQTRHFSGLSIPQNEAFTFTFDQLLSADYGTPVSYEVWLEADGSVSDKVYGETRLYAFKPHRRTVVEEITGMWCPYCSTGTLAMDSLSLKYPDDFIGIALHSRDPLQESNYVEQLPFEALPNAYFNRKVMRGRPMGTVMNGDKARFILDGGGWGTQFLASQAEPTEAELELKVERDGNRVQLETSTRFAVSLAEADYRIAFVLVEDKVYDERFHQYNNLSGSLIEAGGYEDLPYVISAPEFNHVGHSIYDNKKGILQSVPEQVVAGETYTFNYKLQLPLVVRNAENVKIVAMLIHQKTGEITNAVQVPLATATGIALPSASSPESLSWKVEGSSLRATYVTGSQEPVHFGLYTLDGQLCNRQQHPVEASSATAVLPLDRKAGTYILTVQQGRQTLARKILIP